jgi:hypothetical protein
MNALELAQYISGPADQSRETGMVARRVAVFILITAIAVIPTAHADEPIKPGSWKYL